MSCTVIIPSRTASNLVPCVEAVRRYEPLVPIIVIDDGVDWAAASRIRPEVMVIKGESPFIFARNCNLGIRACEGDVILLNDDAMLDTPLGFQQLEVASKAHPEFGVISAVTNLVGNPAQQPKDIGLRSEPRTLAFVCVYIPRTTIEAVGFLDERFTAYGWEDNSYCREVREADLKLGICDDCFVDHSLLVSTFRGKPEHGVDISEGREIYRSIWGDTN